MTLAATLGGAVGAPLAKFLLKNYLGEPTASAATGLIDLAKKNIDDYTASRDAARQFEAVGDRIVAELRPVFEEAGRSDDHLKLEAVAFEVGKTLEGNVEPEFFLSRDLDPARLAADFRRLRPQPVGLSEPETALYDRALDAAARHLVSVVDQLPKYEPAVAAQSLRRLSLIMADLEQVLQTVGRIEEKVSTRGKESGETRFQRYEADYRLAVIRTCDHLELFGAEIAPESQRLLLSVAYVSLNLQSTGKGDNAESEMLPAASVLTSLTPNAGRILIRGDAGSGKSTLFRWTAIQAAMPLEWTVAVELAEHPTLWMTGLADVVTDSDIRKMFTSARTPPRRRGPNIEIRLENREEGFPREFDDLQELVSGSWKRRVPFLIRLRDCPEGKLPAPEDFPKLIAKELGHPPEDWVTSVLRGGRALVLLDGIDEVPNFGRPTLLNEIESLPESYRSLAYEQKRAVLVELAHDMVSNSRSSVPIDVAEYTIGSALKLFPSHANTDPSELRKALVERSGVLREARPGFIDFIHNTFKEFLAADRFVQKRDYRLLAEHALDAAWQPVLLFAVTTRHDRDFATHLLGQILDAAAEPAPAKAAKGKRELGKAAAAAKDRARKLFALHCRALALYLDPALTRRLDALVAEMFLPRHLADAPHLAAMGDIAVERLRYLKAWKATQAVAAARALRLIGTPRALQALEGYRDDRRLSVATELSQSFNPLSLKAFQQVVLSGKSLPKGVRQYVSDLSALAGLASLRTLIVGATKVSDLSPLAGLASLQMLSLSDTPVSDVSPLAGLASLQMLFLHGTKVSDLSPLAGLASLQALYVGNTPVSDVSPLAGLASLQALYLGGTKVSDVSPLAGLTSLQTLSLSDTDVSDVSPLAGLASLKRLYLSDGTFEGAEMRRRIERDVSARRNQPGDDPAAAGGRGAG